MPYMEYETYSNTNYRYLVLEIKEFQSGENTGTNTLLNNSSSILIPNGGTENILNLRPINNLNYPLRKLKNLRNLSFCIKDPDGNILKNEHLDKNLLINDSRHPLHPNNQIQILINVSKVEKN